MGVTQNSYIPRAWEVSDLKVSGAMRPRPLNQILPSHMVYNYYLCLHVNCIRSCGSKYLFCGKSHALYS